MLDDETKREITKKLSGMGKEVEILYFPGPDENSSQISQLLTDMQGLAPKLKITLYQETAPEAAQFSIENVPVMIFRGPGIKGDARFFGFPSGPEFPVFIEVIALAGGNERGGALAGVASSLKSPLLVESFITPTCPYCPTATFITIKFAMMSEHIRGYVYDLPEFPQLSQKYRVQAVPKTVVNEGKLEINGAQPEDIFALELKKMLSTNKP